MTKLVLSILMTMLLAVTARAEDSSTTPSSGTRELLSPDQVAQVQFDLGVQAMRDKKYASAAEAFEKAVQTKGDFSEAYNNWGIALVQLGKRSLNGEQQVQLFQTAADKFSKAAELKPDEKLTYVLWSETLVLLGDLVGDPRAKLSCYQGAVERCRKAVELGPQDWEAYNKWAVILSTKLPEFIVNEQARHQLMLEAAVLFGKAAERARFSGEIGPVYANWASALVQASKAVPDTGKKQTLLRDALDKFERSARALPGAAGTYAMWGSALIEAGKLSGSRTDFRDGINKLNASLELHPNDAAALYNLACGYALMDNPVMAVQYLKKCFELDRSSTYRTGAPRDPDLKNLRDDAEFKELYGVGPTRGGPSRYNPPLSPR